MRESLHDEISPVLRIDVAHGTVLTQADSKGTPAPKSGAASKVTCQSAPSTSTLDEEKGVVRTGRTLTLTPVTKSMDFLTNGCRILSMIIVLASYSLIMDS